MFTWIKTKEAACGIGPRHDKIVSLLLDFTQHMNFTIIVLNIGRTHYFINSACHDI